MRPCRNERCSFPYVWSGRKDVNYITDLVRRSVVLTIFAGCLRLCRAVRWYGSSNPSKRPFRVHTSEYTVARASVLASDKPLVYLISTISPRDGMWRDCSLDIRTWSELHGLISRPVRVVGMCIVSVPSGITWELSGLTSVGRTPPLVLSIHFGSPPLPAVGTNGWWFVRCRMWIQGSIARGRGPVTIIGLTVVCHWLFFGRPECDPPTVRGEGLSLQPDCCDRHCSGSPLLGVSTIRVEGVKWYSPGSSPGASLPSEIVGPVFATVYVFACLNLLVSRDRICTPAGLTSWSGGIVKDGLNLALKIFGRSIWLVPPETLHGHVSR